MLLWCHVVGASKVFAGGGGSRKAGCVIEGKTDREVDEDATAGTNHDILGTYVAMDDVLLVCRPERVEKLDHQADGKPVL
jgi:hypothetical protein